MVYIISNEFLFGLRCEVDHLLAVLSARGFKLNDNHAQRWQLLTPLAHCGIDTLKLRRAAVKLATFEETQLEGIQYN